jgi:hypothetical protein
MSIARDISRQTSRQTVTLTANQTAVTVTGGFSGASIETYLNGVRLIQGSDYSLNGTSGITLTQGASAGDIIEFSIRNTSNSGLSAVNTSEIVDEAVTADKLSDSSTETENVKRRVAAAWVNFQGNGTVGIRDEYNVDSITDLGSTGYYQVNFKRAFANNDFAMAGTARFTQNANNTTATVQIHRNRTLDSGMTTTSVIITTTYSTGTLFDSEYVGLIFFGESS